MDSSPTRHFPDILNTAEKKVEKEEKDIGNIVGEMYGWGTVLESTKWPTFFVLVKGELRSKMFLLLFCSNKLRKDSEKVFFAQITLIARKLA